jgi:hypothetical protein
MKNKQLPFSPRERYERLLIIKQVSELADLPDKYKTHIISILVENRFPQKPKQ